MRCGRGRVLCPWLDVRTETALLATPRPPPATSLSERFPSTPK